jgi:hypothetical protein
MPHSPLSDSDSTATFQIPALARRWLDSYEITEEETHSLGVWYDLSKDLLIFPIYDGSRLVCTNGRYFGSNPAYPKYITWGLKSNHYKLFPQRESNIYVLVEDFVSAIKVGRSFNCIPLLGSTIPPRLIFSLVPSHPILRIWLDPDKNQEAIKQAQIARQWHPNCGTIITEMDPKDYTDAGIKDEVESTLSDFEKLSASWNIQQIQ